MAVAARIVEAAFDLDNADFSTVFSKPSSTLRNFLSRFDAAVVWMRDSGEIKAVFQDCGISDVRCFPGLPPEDWACQASEYYLACLDEPGALRTILSIPPTPTQVDVVLHPGSGGKQKNWPVECFYEVAGALSSWGHSVSWCVGPAEIGLRSPSCASYLYEPSLVSLGGTLAKATLYVGNDCGITHLAAAVGTPTIAIFGPTNPAVWAPRGDHVHVVAQQPWPGATAVIKRARSLLA